MNVPTRPIHSSRWMHAVTCSRQSRALPLRQTPQAHAPRTRALARTHARAPPPTAHVTSTAHTPTKHHLLGPLLRWTLRPLLIASHSFSSSAPLIACPSSAHRQLVVWGLLSGRWVSCSATCSACTERGGGAKGERGSVALAVPGAEVLLHHLASGRRASGRAS